VKKPKSARRETRKGYLVQMLDVSSETIGCLKKAGHGKTVKDVLTAAVNSKLNQLERQLLELCLDASLETGKRVPRQVDPEIWEKVGQAAEITGVSRPALLRACLEQLKQDATTGS
jgi:hypothetical protein